MSIADYADARKFFATRREAREYAAQNGGAVERVGRFSVGSFGVYPHPRWTAAGHVRESNDQTMIIWAVRIAD